MVLPFLWALCGEIEASPNSVGGKGLWRVESGDLEGRGAWSFGIHSESWGKEYEHTYGTNRHIELVTHLGLGFCPGEALSLVAALPINSYMDSEPESSRKSALGDLRLSLALSRPVGRFLKVSGSVYSEFPTGNEETEFSETGEPFGNGSAQLGVMGLITADFADRGEFPPFRVHLNAGYHHNYAEVLGAEDATNEYLPLRLGLELPTSPFTPFLEFTSEWHMNNDTMPMRESPMRLTPGLRFIRSGLSLDLASDINLSAELPNGEKTEPYDWRLLLGLGLTRVPGKLPSTGSIAGRVTDSETGDPLRAHISFPGTGIADLESDPLTGSYSLNEVPASLLTVQVEKQGYQRRIAPIFVKGGEVAVRDFVLRRADLKAVVLGKVTDGLTGEPLFAKVSFAQSVVKCDSHGNFEISLPTGEYPVLASHRGYSDVLDTLSVEAGEEVVLQIPLQRTEPVTVEGLTFRRGKAELLPESRPALERIAQLFEDNPELRLEIQGHTDSQGSSSFNLDLSQKRADAIKTCLTREFGVESDRLVAKGYGESRPIADNSSEQGRSRNRRIDLLILQR